jgi:methionine sulfoxide reductase heme-binding subunit
MILWELARASAFVAFGCYTLVVTWGILLAGRGFRPAAPAMAFHRFLSSLGLVAVTTHIASLLLDSYAKVHLQALAGLGTSRSVLAGVIAMWLMLALPFSFWLRRSKLISQRVWRGFHYSGYAIWVLILFHGMARGTDSRSPWAAAAYGTAAALVAGATWWRVSKQPVARVLQERS